MNIEMAAARARIPPTSEEVLLSNAGIKVLSSNHKKNRMVIQSAIVEISMGISSSYNDLDLIAFSDKEHEQRANVARENNLVWIGQEWDMTRKWYFHCKVQLVCTI
jgi:hypothetical protein